MFKAAAKKHCFVVAEQTPAQRTQLPGRQAETRQQVGVTCRMYAVYRCTVYAVYRCTVYPVCCTQYGVQTRSLAKKEIENIQNSPQYLCQASGGAVGFTTSDALSVKYSRYLTLVRVMRRQQKHPEETGALAGQERGCEDVTLFRVSVLQLGVPGGGPGQL